MEGNQRKPRRMFTPEQKYEIIKDLERYPTIREGLAKGHAISATFKDLGISRSTYHSWSKLKKEKEIGSTIRKLTPVENWFPFRLLLRFHPTRGHHKLGSKLPLIQGTRRYKLQTIEGGPGKQC